MLAPDTSHGTNPASVTMAGYEVVKVATNERGGVEMDDLRAKIDEPTVACLMLTNPNTLGLFDENIAEIAGADPRGGRHALLRRRQPQRGDGPLAARRHGLRHRPRQPAQVLQPAARRRRPGRRADRRLGADRALPAAAAGGAARGRQRRRPELRPRPRAAQVDRPPARLPGQLRRLRPLLRLHPQPRRRRPRRGLGDRGAERQLPEGAAAPRAAPASACRSPSTATACTSSSSPASR